MSTFLEFLLNLFSGDRRSHRSREPTFVRPSGSRERRVEEELVFRYTAPGGGTRDFKIRDATAVRRDRK